MQHIYLPLQYTNRPVSRHSISIVTLLKSSFHPISSQCQEYIASAENGSNSANIKPVSARPSGWQKRYRFYQARTTAPSLSAPLIHHHQHLRRLPKTPRLLWIIP
eukprot:scaffold3259_cov71-Skeletonema_marinoi.AAC.3